MERCSCEGAYRPWRNRAKGGVSVFSVQELAADVYPALYRELAEHPERVSTFFPLAPESPRAWQLRAEEVRRLWGTPDAAERRGALASALHAGLARWGVPTAAQQRSLEALRRPDALVVVTGQQAGLLGGPLYTLYKALGAVILAQRAAQELGCPVIPIFWIASEDHDWSEISHAHVVAPNGDVMRLSLPGSGDFRSAGHIPVPPEARHLVGQLTSLCPPRPAGTALAEHLLEGLRRTGRVTLADWFGWQLQGLLGETGLLFYDPMQPALRALAADVFAGAVHRHSEANARISAAGQAMTAAGFTPGLDMDADHVHLLTYVGGRRVALHAEGGRIRTRDGQVDCAPAELVERVRLDPTSFSPNVALRPIVQDFTLPVLAQLGGPGEVAYLAQLGGVFALWDRPAPIVGPRPGATLMMPADVRALSAAGARPEEVRSDLGHVLDRAVATRSPIDLDAVFGAERAALQERYVRLEAALSQVSPHLTDIVRGNRERVGYQLDYLERKGRQHLRRAQRDLVSALRVAAGRLFPAGGLQERVVGPYPYLFQMGPELITQIRAALEGAPGPFGRHWLLLWEAE